MEECILDFTCIDLVNVSTTNLSFSATVGGERLRHDFTTCQIFVRKEKHHLTVFFSKGINSTYMFAFISVTVGSFLKYAKKTD